MMVWEYGVEVELVKMWIPNIMCYRYAWNWILTQREQLALDAM